MRRAPGTIVLAFLLSGCVLFPGFPPMDMTESTVVIKNQSENDLVVRFDSPDFPLAFAVPARTTGSAQLYGGASNGVDLLADDCTVLAEAAIDAEMTYIRIGPDGESISMPDAEPPESSRTLAEYFDCDGFGLEPRMEDVDLSELAGTMVVGSGGGIWAVDLPDGELRRLNDDEWFGAEGALSPDGSAVAVTRYDDTSMAASVWLLDLGGRDPRQTAEGASFPAWSPDGMRIAAVDADPFGGGLLVVELETDGITRIEGGVVGAAPAWSPDGGQLAYAESATPASPPSTPDGAVMIATLDGERREVARLPAPGPLAWSPDGTLLAVETWDGTTSGIVVLDVADGEAVFRLDAGMAMSAAPAWSPDGVRLALVRGTVFGGSEIVVADADGGESVSLGELSGSSIFPPIVWSPDGSGVLASAFGMTDGGLWLFSADGDEPTKIMSGVDSLIGWR